MSEVFVSDRAAFFGGAWPQGFTALAAAPAAQFLAQAHGTGRFVARATAEQNPAWKQWIPYCLIRCASAIDAGVFCVRRTKGQSETRLHGLWSIGLGGHIEPCDAAAELAAPAFFAAALGRELREELQFPPTLTPTPRLVGLLNDDQTAVGAVHAGLVFVWDLPHSVPAANSLVRVGEIGKMEGCFRGLVEFANLWQTRSQFESWSQLLVDAGLVPQTGVACG